MAFVVTIDRPQGVYYGGQIAAPLTARMLRQALAARRSAIDRRALADGTAEQPAPGGKLAEKPGAPVAAMRLPAQIRSDNGHMNAEGFRTSPGSGLARPRSRCIVADSGYGSPAAA